MKAEGARATLEQYARRLVVQRRQRERPRAMRVERPRRARDADLPIDFRVIRLELVVGERPIIEAGAGDRSEQRPLAKIDRTKTPVVRREMHAGAADAAAIGEPASSIARPRLVVARAKRLKRLERRVEHPALAL